MRTEVFDDPGRLAGLLPAWDALAVSERLPYCAPAWQLAWWRHAAPPKAVLRVVAAWDGDRLAGIAPCYAVEAPLGTWRFALLAARISSRIQPLAAPADREACAAAFAAALAGGDPAPNTLHLSQIPEESPWPALLRDAWPGGPASLHHEVTVPAPVVNLGGGDLDAWLATRSSNFRSQVRRARRKLVEQGGGFKDTTAEDVEHGVAELARLHAARWDRRGGSEGMTAGVDRMLVDAGRELIPDRRASIMRVELGGRSIAADLFVSAGGEVTFWNGGFDVEHAALRPGILDLVEVVGEAIAAGCDRLDLGPGDAAYKHRLADAEDRLATWTMVCPGAGARRARAIVAGRALRRRVGELLGERGRERVRSVAGRFSRGG